MSSSGVSVVTGPSVPSSRKSFLPYRSTQSVPTRRHTRLLTGDRVLNRCSSVYYSLSLCHTTPVSGPFGSTGTLGVPPRGLVPPEGPSSLQIRLWTPHVCVRGPFLPLRSDSLVVSVSGPRLSSVSSKPLDFHLFGPTLYPESSRIPTRSHNKDLGTSLVVSSTTPGVNLWSETTTHPLPSPSFHPTTDLSTTSVRTLPLGPSLR